MRQKSLDRLARAYEADADNLHLLQDIYLALWRTFEHFAGRCSLRTWVYQVAHNTAVSYVIRQQRTYARLISLDHMEEIPVAGDSKDRSLTLEKLFDLIHRLAPLDRQVILSYLEGMDSASIGEITGISPAAVAMKISRRQADPG